VNDPRPEDQPPASKATNMLYVAVGVGMSLVAVVLMIPVAPMLLFARDSRDMTGGIAGTVVVVIMLVTGLVLILRENAPPALLRTFYFLIGGLSVVAGVGVIASALYEMSQGERVNRRALLMPFGFVAFGVEWVRRGMNVGNRPEPEADEAV